LGFERTGDGRLGLDVLHVVESNVGTPGGNSHSFENSVVENNGVKITGVGKSS
jgi:hypothetical protein